MKINPALKALTVPDEQIELSVIEPRKRKIRFAFFQKLLDGGKIPMWNVEDPDHKCFNSTLSMEGLRDWKVL